MFGNAMILAAMIAATGTSLQAMAQPSYPGCDNIEGRWSNGGDEMQIFQAPDCSVTAVMVNGGTTHLFTGHLNGQQVSGSLQRINRPSRCLTYMQLPFRRLLTT